MLDYEFYHYLTVDTQQTVSLPAIDQSDDGILTSNALYFNCFDKRAGPKTILFV